MDAMLELFFTKMKENLIISNYCKIANNKVSLNGNLIFASELDNKFSDFIKETYKHFQINYQ